MQMKKWMAAFCLLGVALNPIAQITAQTIARSTPPMSISPKGEVRDSLTATPLAGATVEITAFGGDPSRSLRSYNSGSNSVQTDESGNFIFRPLRPARGSATYRIKVSNVGYRSYEAFILLEPGNDQAIRVRLQRIDLFMQPIEVKALRAGDKAPFAKTDIDKQQLEKINLGQDIPFLLNQTPSVVINSDAGNGVGYMGLYIRGTDDSRINMTLNGLPYNDPEEQSLFFVDIPDLASSTSSIQIQRGVGTSSNGAGAFGATINFSTNEFNDKAYGESNNSFGSFNTWKNTIRVGSRSHRRPFHHRCPIIPDQQ